MTLRIPLLLFALGAVGASEVIRVPGNGSWHQKQENTSPLSFGDLDGDGDGKVSSAELHAARQQFVRAVKECRASLMESLDGDDNGRLSRFEAGEGKGRIGSLIAQARALVRGAHDADKDGTVTEAEAPHVIAAVRNLLTRSGARGVDVDGKRGISKDEAADAMRAIAEGGGTLFRLCDRNNDGQLSQMEADLAFELILAVANQ